MSLDLLTFYPHACCVFRSCDRSFCYSNTSITQIVRLILSSNCLLRPYVSRRPRPLLSTFLSHCESVFFVSLQDQVSLLYETTACSNVHVSPNNTKFFEGTYISLCWPFECCHFDDDTSSSSSSSNLSDDRSKASSKTMPPHSAI